MRRWWWSPAATAAAGLVVAAFAVPEDGGRGVLSALLGAALVIGFLGTGALPVLLVRGQEANTGLGMGLLLLNYSMRLVVALAVLQVASRSDAVEPRWTAYAVVACALVWAAATAVAVLGSSRDGGAPAAPGRDGTRDRGGSRGRDEPL